MSMFSNYFDNEGPKNNIISYEEPELQKVQVGPVIYKRDYAGNITSATWHHNDIFTFEDTLNMCIGVPENSLVYEFSEQTPINQAPPTIYGQYAYNVWTWRCWVCTYDENEHLYWKETALYQDPKSCKIITLLRNVGGMHTIVNILNFRKEVLYSFTLKDTANIKINIDTQELPLLVSGQYCFEIISASEESARTLKNIPITIL